VGGSIGDSLVLSRTGTDTCGEWYPDIARKSSRLGYRFTSQGY